MLADRITRSTLQALRAQDIAATVHVVALRPLASGIAGALGAACRVNRSRQA